MRRLALATIVALAIAACSKSPASPSPPSHASEKPSAPGKKQPLAGLVDMQDIAWHDADDGEPTFTLDYVKKFPGVFGGVVINATWRAMEPARSGALVVEKIDAALAEVRAYNAEHAKAPLGVKLRVYAGSDAPDWAKAIDGGPVHIDRNAKGCAKGPCPLTVGRTWSPEYVRAWREFQKKLAARYDHDPLVRQVAVTSCGTQTDEPFVPSTEPSSREALVAAGYGDDAQRRCLEGAIDDYAPWKETLVDYTFNVFGRTKGPPDAEFPVRVMRKCREVFGARCVLDNHALAADLREVDQPIYDAMQSLGGPIEFQTEAPRGMGCRWTATVARGVSLGAISIEVWPEERFQGFEAFTRADVEKLAHEFASKPAVSTAASDCPGFH